jgi:membrane-associated phospholipid phosphatase
MTIVDTFASVTSLSVIFTTIIPIVIYLYNQSRVYLYFGIATLGSNVLNGLLKLLFSTRLSAFKRPAEAMNCNSWNSGGKCGGKAGFPSGHTQSTMFFAIFLYLITQNKWLLFAGLLWTFAVAFSRMRRRCHTLLQVIFGALFGIIYSFAIYYLFVYWGIL